MLGHEFKGEDRMVCIAKFLTKIADKASAFRNNEDGLTLTEYVVTLGLLTGAVVLAVITFGSNLADVWTNWGTFIGLLAEDVPDEIPDVP